MAAVLAMTGGGGVLATTIVPGSLDTTFDPGTGVNSTVYSVALQSDGKILIGGGFTTFQGSTAGGIARLNTDGTRDASFNAGGAGANNVITSVAVQANGKILIGGNFTTYNGAPAVRIARLNTDGTRDADFNAGGAGANNWVDSVAVQTDGRILIGGDLTQYNGTSRKRIARLNTDGSLDGTFDPGSGSDGPNLGVKSITVQADGKILIGEPSRI